MNKDKKQRKPTLLCILDGWGFGDEDSKSNAIAMAKTENYDRFLRDYSFSALETSGLAVGLPDGQIGNSEVGHMTIGAGRVIFQDLPRINQMIASDEFKNNTDLQKLISEFQGQEKSVHLCGLLSDGGVHSHQNHIAYLAKLLAENNVKVLVHAFLDGRDVAQKSAVKFYDEFLDLVENHENIEIATVSGRYYAMDRDKKWDRVKLAYEAVADGKTSQQKEYSKDQFRDLIQDCYEQETYDEFVKPCAFSDYSGVNDGDALVFCNFRADRARQISESLIDPDFSGFERRLIDFSHKLSMTSYSDNLDKFYKVLFPSIEVKKSLPEVLASESKAQLRIAETEKYAHVTFFFSCGQEQELSGEKRILIPSPNVATYDLQPEMSASKVTENLVDAIESGEFDFIVVNYANPDMVGHSGEMQAAMKACEVIDEQLGALERSVLKVGGVMLISADHGNIECMKDENGAAHTAHTTNLVPFILVKEDSKDFALSDGNLSDIAPTILNLMNIEKPAEMTGKSLIAKK